MEHVVLNNGLNILFHPMLNTHSVTIGLYVRAGSCYEDAGQTGITHFLEHLHFRRLGNMSQEELYYKMERMGSTLKGVTYCDFLEFSMKITPDRMRESLLIFKNIINADDWSDEEFSKEKQVVLNEIAEKGDYVSVEDTVRNSVFYKSQLANKIIGSAESIENLRKEDVKRYKKQVFNKNNFIFCITGHVTQSDWFWLQNELENFCIPEGEAKKRISMPEVFHRRKPTIVFQTIEDDLLEVNLSFDISCDEKTEELLPILNCILGEGTGSRLQKHVRENLGYTSDIRSYLDWYSGFAVLHIRFSVNKKLLSPCLYEIVRIVNEIKNSIVKQDLDVSLPFYTTNMVFLEDDTEEMNFQLAYNQFVLGKEYNPSSLKNNGETIIRLQELAKKVFVPENVCTVIVGNTRGITKKKLLETMGISVKSSTRLLLNN